MREQKSGSLESCWRATEQDDRGRVGNKHPEVGGEKS